MKAIPRLRPLLERQIRRHDSAVCHNSLSGLWEDCEESHQSRLVSKHGESATFAELSPPIGSCDRLFSLGIIKQNKTQNQAHSRPICVFYQIVLDLISVGIGEARKFSSSGKFVLNKTANVDINS